MQRNDIYDNKAYFIRVKNQKKIHFMDFSLIVSPVRSTYGGYYGLVVVTPPRPRPRPHFIVYAITLENLIGLLPYLICRLI